MALKDKKDSAMIILTEKFTVKEDKETGGLRIEGLALPVGKVGRNRTRYNKESVEAAKDSLIGTSFLLNHKEDFVLGHVTAARMAEEGLYYTADLDATPVLPELAQAIRNLKRGDISKVSIQAIPERMQPGKEATDIQIKEFLELSAVTIPGFDDTTVQFMEKFMGAEAEIKTKKEGGTMEGDTKDGGTGTGADNKGGEGDAKTVADCMAQINALDARCAKCEAEIAELKGKKEGEGDDAKKKADDEAKKKAEEDEKKKSEEAAKAKTQKEDVKFKSFGGAAEPGNKEAYNAKGKESKKIVKTSQIFEAISRGDKKVEA